jgi:hypothetical protein
MLGVVLVVGMAQTSKEATVLNEDVKMCKIVLQHSRFSVADLFCDDNVETFCKASCKR